jgi:hypothetical protein
MKKLLITLALFIPVFALKAQQPPALQQGSVVNYTLRLHGQQVAFSLTLTRLADSVVLDWKMRNTTSGTYVIVPDAVRSASKLSFVQPEPDKKVVLPADQTFWFISKNAFQNLLQKHSYEYDNTIYDLKNDGKPETLLVDGKKLEVLHVAARNETTEYWILNNPNLPLICRITGNPLEVDMEINSIK